MVDLLIQRTLRRRSNQIRRSFTVRRWANPDMAVFPFEEVSAIAKKHKVPLMIDNTCATSYLCRPFELGANIVTYSTTKFLGGHGTSIGGMIIDGGNFDWTSGRFDNFTTPDHHTTA